MSVQRSIDNQIRQTFLLLFFGLSFFFILIDFLEKSSRGSYPIGTLISYEITRLLPLAITLLPLVWSVSLLLIAYSFNVKKILSTLSIIGASQQQLFFSLLYTPLFLTALLLFFHLGVNPILEHQSNQYRSLLLGEERIQENHNIWSVREKNGVFHILHIDYITAQSKCLGIRYIQISDNKTIRVMANEGKVDRNNLLLMNAQVIMQSMQKKHKEYSLKGIPNIKDLTNDNHPSFITSLLIDSISSAEARELLLHQIQPFIESLMIILIGIGLITIYTMFPIIYFLLAATYPSISLVKLIFNL